MTKPRILVVGSSVVDLHIKIRSLPERGEKTVTSNPYAFVPSGLGLISAVSASSFGSDVLFCTKVGADSHGDKLKSVFINNGIDLRFVFTDKKRSTALETFITDSSGISRSIYCPAANSTLSENELEEAFISYPDSLLIQGDVSDDILTESIYLANKKNIPVMFDPAQIDFNEFDVNSLGDIEIFSPNADEAYALSGIYPDSVESCLKACIKIINKIKCHYIVIKLRQKGCFIFDGVYSEIVPSFETEVADRAGVGSVFDSALLHRYLQNSDIISGAVYANMCSSLCLSHQGGFASIPKLSDIEEFISRNKLNFEG